MNRNQKGSPQFNEAPLKRGEVGFAPILIVIVIAVIAGYFLFTQKGKYTTTPPSQTSSSGIQNNSDLDNTEKDLDNTNTNQVDTELKLLDSDSSSF